MTSHRFTVFVACDVGSGQLNTGIEFPHRPAGLREVISVAEALYSKERQMAQDDPSAVFRCASCLLMTGHSGVVGASRWAEVETIEQVPNKGQLYIFDWTSPAPPKGEIPAVQFIVQSHELEAAVHRPSSSTRRRERAGGSNLAVSRENSAAFVESSHARSSAPIRREPSGPGPTRTPQHAGTSATPRFRVQRPDSSFAASSPSAAAPPPAVGSVSTPPRMMPKRAPTVLSGAASGLSTSLPREGQDFLFRQLCQASGSDSAISTQRLHTICVENDLMFPTDTFSIMVHHQVQLSYDQWRRLVEEYGPVVDALYERIADRNRDSMSPEVNAAKRDIDRLRHKIRGLEDEEQELIARQAQLKRDTLQAQRDLRDAERRLASAEEMAGEEPDRAKEWEMLTKFVALKVRQVRLLEEEAKVNHELSLL